MFFLFNDLSPKPLIFAAILFMVGCNSQPLVDVPDHFPALLVPAENPLTKEKIILGRSLFYETALSSDSTVSCASCHIQELAFTDGKPVSMGVHGRSGERNSPALQNLAYYPYFFQDGGIPTLEMQVEAPLFTDVEMNLSYYEAAKRLNADEKYVTMFQAAFETEADAFSITRALAAFERTLISGSSNYDKYLEGSYELSSSEEKGRALFFSDELGCTSCHSGILFTDFSLVNIGLYTVYADTGLARITKKPQDSGKFRVPSLRNVELTAPYFHDGSASSLSEVIQHFAKGGNSHNNKDERLKGFQITENEEAELISFLLTLTDKHFIQNDLLSNPN